MQLLELTSSELDFLKAQPAAYDHLQQRLTQRLAANLTARLRLPVSLHMLADADAAEIRASPVWQADVALATLWLTRRLGGQRVVGKASFVPRTLIQNLDEVLAECWLDGEAPNALPAALAWQLAAGTGRAELAVNFPHRVSDMTNWAQSVIRHV